MAKRQWSNYCSRKFDRVAELKSYILPKDAFADLRDIRDYLQEQAGAEVALRGVRKLRAAMHRISLDPMAGQVRGDLTSSPFRVWTVSPYLIFYIGRRKPIPIVRILHGRRNVSCLHKKEVALAYSQIRTRTPILPTIGVPSVSVGVRPTSIWRSNRFSPVAKTSKRVPT
jgi:plasmid stabilization system protein ParE